MTDAEIWMVDLDGTGSMHSAGKGDPGAVGYTRTDTLPTWQPIDTAPRDGTEVIVMHCTYYGDGISPTIDGPFTAAFQNGEWRSSWDGSEVIEYMDWGGTDYKYIMAPTHWMPLPTPPKGPTHD